MCDWYLLITHLFFMQIIRKKLTHTRKKII